MDLSLRMADAGTPFLLQLILFYRLPIIGVVNVTSRLIAFILNYAFYFAEIFRGGFNRSIMANMKGTGLTVELLQTLHESSFPK